jgi:hypothetical protein
MKNKRTIQHTTISTCVFFPNLILKHLCLIYIHLVGSSVLTPCDVLLVMAADDSFKKICASSFIPTHEISILLGYCAPSTLRIGNLSTEKSTAIGTSYISTTLNRIFANMLNNNQERSKASKMCPRMHGTIFFKILFRVKMSNSRCGCWHAES